MKNNYFKFKFEGLKLPTNLIYNLQKFNRSRYLGFMFWDESERILNLSNKNNNFIFSGKFFQGLYKFDSSWNIKSLDTRFELKKVSDFFSPYMMNLNIKFLLNENSKKNLLLWIYCNIFKHWGSKLIFENNEKDNFLMYKKYLIDVADLPDNIIRYPDFKNQFTIDNALQSRNIFHYDQEKFSNISLNILKYSDETNYNIDFKNFNKKTIEQYNLNSLEGEQGVEYLDQVDENINKFWNEKDPVKKAKELNIILNNIESKLDLFENKKYLLKDNNFKNNYDTLKLKQRIVLLYIDEIDNNKENKVKNVDQKDIDRDIV